MDEESEAGVRHVRLEFVGAMALGVTLLCVLVGQTAQRFADQEAPLPIETAKLKPHFNTVDYATTASIKNGVVIITPCDTHTP
jgi:hypothetical protein